MHYRMTVILTEQPEGGYAVTCEELPELLTEGTSVDEALENVKDAFAATIELYEDLGWTLPEKIHVRDEDVSVEDRPFWFQTMTPKPKSKSRFDESVPDVIPSYWFAAIAREIESRPHAL